MVDTEQLNKTMSDLSKKMDKSKWADLAMKIASGVSAAGILAVFALFTNTVPGIVGSINELTWNQQDMQKDIAKILGEDFMTVSDYQDRERMQNKEMSDFSATIKFHSSWIKEQGRMTMDHNYRLNSLEKVLDDAGGPNHDNQK